VQLRLRRVFVSFPWPAHRRCPACKNWTPGADPVARRQTKALGRHQANRSRRAGYPVMAGGRRVGPQPSLHDNRAHARHELGRLPAELKELLRGIEWVILAQYRGSAFFGPILLFDRYHPSAPTCTRDTPTRAAAVKDGPPSGHHRREASLTATSTTA